MAFLKQLTLGRKCIQCITVIVIVCVIEMILHFNTIRTASGLLPGEKSTLVHYITRTNDTLTHSYRKLVSNISHSETIVYHELVIEPPKLYKFKGAFINTTVVSVFNSTEERGYIKQNVALDRCVSFWARDGSKICIHKPEEDIWVSKEIIKTGAWEKDLLQIMSNFLQAEPDMRLLDVGCNIGVFTLTSAILGHPVVAIDVNKVNLGMLSMSLTLNDLHDKVALVRNAVSDVYEQVEFVITPKNIGGTYVKAATSGSASEKVPTIRIDDLIPPFRGRPTFVKMDIEGSEWRALNGAWAFFKEVDVKYVLMEYVNHRNKESGKQIRNFFATYGFLPHALPSFQTLLDVNNDQQWTGNVLWVKKGIT